MVNFSFEQPSDFARNPSFYSSDLSWWISNCSRGMGCWKDASGKGWSFAELMIEISRRLENLEDFEIYLIAAAKFLKPDDAEITKYETPSEDPKAGEIQVENKIKP